MIPASDPRAPRLQEILEGKNHNGNPRPKTLRRLDVARMAVTDPPEVDWVVPGLVARGLLSTLVGREGQGKSLVASSLCAAVACGDSVGGFACEPARVMIVDAENGENEIHRRMKNLGLPGENVWIFEAEGFHLERDLSELEQALEEIRPDLLILDSFRSLWPGGKENEAGDVAAALDPLRNLIRRLEVGTLLLHHTGKGQNGYRGSTAFGACVEIGFALERIEDDPQKATRRRLRCFKCRPAAEPPDKWLGLHVEQEMVFIEPVEGFENDEAESSRAPAQAELAPRLLAAASQAITWPDLASAVGRHRRDGTARRIRDALAKNGLLTNTDGFWLAAPQGATGAMGAKGVAPPIDPLDKSSMEGVPGCQPPSGTAGVAPPREDLPMDHVLAAFNAGSDLKWTDDEGVPIVSPHDEEQWA